MKTFPRIPNSEFRIPNVSVSGNVSSSLRTPHLASAEPPAQPGSALRNSPAFSLVEILIAVSLMGFMVLGLMAMFSFTQRAFRVGMAQTDVLEAGRAAISLMAGEFEEATPAGFGTVTNFYVHYYDYDYTTNSLAGTKPARTNVLEQSFFLVQQNQRWFGLGYLVAVPNQKVKDLGVGTLYRFQEPLSEGTNNPVNLCSYFLRVATNAIFNRPDLVQEINNNSNISTNLHRIADGIVHFRVLAYNLTNGLIVPPGTNGIYASTNSFIPPPEITYVFTNNAVPAYLDLELGVLESAAWEKIKSLPGSVKREYLRQQAARIHVFRRHVAVHNVDPEAYP